jgi:cystathionine beta-lyase family protein involved in aluminum resistance
MEALKMSSQVNSWNDDRLDELNRRVDNGFKSVDKHFEQVEQEMKEGFARVDKRFEKIEQETTEGFARVDARFEKIDGRLAQTPTRTEMNEGFAEMRAAYAALNRTLLVGALAIVAALIGVVGTLVVS